MILKLHDYKYFPYELELARREIESITDSDFSFNSEDGGRIRNDIPSEKLEQLVYFKTYEKGNTIFQTTQAKLEGFSEDERQTKRQNTRYSAHGIHEYKGKFNPQIVRSIFNILGVDHRSQVLDPFCGSGTTLLEATHGSFDSLGIDINPLAAYIANAKQLAISTDSEILFDLLESIKVVIKSKTIPDESQWDPDTVEYLKRWFLPEYFHEITTLHNAISNSTRTKAPIFLTLLSGLLRQYSMQEPQDLRIRRRKSPYPDTGFTEQYFTVASQFIGKIRHTQTSLGKVPKPRSKAIVADIGDNISNLKRLRLGQFSFAITSPPYATALPYIDTDRLSLVWLKLLNPKQIHRHQSMLIGSREVSSAQRQTWIKHFTANQNNLPSSAIQICKELELNISDTDGFRRKAVPFLLYRYFSQMQTMFINLQDFLTPDSKFALVVGKNRTTLGGTPFIIDTPTCLAKIAESVGFNVNELIPLQTYQRYSLHQTNSINEETLLILGFNN